MKEESRWVEVAALVEKLLADGRLRERLRKATREEQAKILDELGFTAKDRQWIERDIRVLYPGSEPGIRELAVFW